MLKKITSCLAPLILLIVAACSNTGPIVTVEAEGETLIFNVEDIKFVKVDQPRTSAPLLKFCLHPAAATQLKSFTAKHRGKPMVIIIADQPVTSSVITAPNVSGCLSATSRYAELYAEKMQP